MIPASLLLILVAVGLLVLGLTGGSSGMLIGSIVASLLAAVALVIGARQNAGKRDGEAQRAQPEPTTGVGSPAPSAQSDSARPDFGQSDLAHANFVQADFVRSDRAQPDYIAEPEYVAEADFARQAGLIGPHADQTQPETAAGQASERDVDLDLPDPSGWESPDEPLSTQPVTTQPLTTQPVDEHAARAAREDGPDYGRASSVINAARSDNPDENAWRRQTLDAHAEATAHADMPGLSDDFGEPDADDPDDEPLPQAVRPADAVRVARMDAEVLVVDGRPRYHLADCAHLVGRLTEPIPVNEAVELGFSPCGLCRPVDRLVAAAARR